MDDRIAYDAYEAQVSLANWCAGSIGTAINTGTMADLRPYDTESMQRLAKSLPHLLIGAATFAVSRDASQLVKHAAMSMPSQPFIASDLPARHGFIYFVDPMPVTDVRLKTIPISAFLYATTDNGFALWWFSDLRHDPDFVSSDAEAPLPAMLRTGYLNRLSLFHFETHRFGVDPGDKEFRRNDGGEVPIETKMSQRYWHKYLASFFAFVQQRVVTQTQWRAPRAVLRRAERENRSVDAVRIVTLRRAAHRDRDMSDASEVAWTHRWIVSGHWRDQWYPSLNAHRAIWISPFVKGPDDRPLVQKTLIHKVAR